MYYLTKSKMIMHSSSFPTHPEVDSAIKRAHTLLLKFLRYVWDFIFYQIQMCVTDSKKLENGRIKAGAAFLLYYIV